MLCIRSLALLLLLTSRFVAGAQGVPSVPLPAPPAAANAAAGTIFDAMLAIGRAATTNPTGAQNAIFSYNAAIQQYNAGDLSRARASALQAISQTVYQPIGAPAASTIAPITPYTPAFVPGLTSIAQVDAEAFLALARRALIACSTERSSNLAETRLLYERAVHENLAQRYQDVRRDAAAIITSCAPAQRALNQLQATPAPSR